MMLWALTDSFVFPLLQMLELLRFITQVTAHAGKDVEQVEYSSITGTSNAASMESNMMMGLQKIGNQSTSRISYASFGYIP